MHINDYLRRERLVLSNFPAGGVIGTAASTVDICSAISIAQTTAGQTIIFPNPTIVDSGLDVQVVNNGSSSFTVAGLIVNPGTYGHVSWQDSAWRSITASSSSPVADNWRSGVGVLPDGISDTTEKVYHDGSVVIGSNDLTVPSRLLVVNTNDDIATFSNTTTGFNPLSTQTKLSFRGRYWSGTTAVVDQAALKVVKQAADGSAGTKMVLGVTNPGNVVTDQLELLSTGQLKLNAYTTAGAFTGTAIGTLGYDAAGNIISAPAAPVADMWRSGVGATTLPDGVTDTTEAIRRNGAVGLNVDALSTLDVAGSYGVGTTTTAVAAYTVILTDAVVILSGLIAQAITLPAAAAFPRRILTLVNNVTVDKTFTPLANALIGGTLGSIPANTSIELQSNGVNWVEIRNTRSVASTANFSQVLASGSVDIADPIPNGARPIVSQFNVASATGLDGVGNDARLQVTFLIAAANANYLINGSLRSKNPANWNNDNDALWSVVSKSTTGFVVSVRELNSVTQDLFLDFECTTFQNAPATLSLPEIAQFIALDTPVILDNIRLEARLTAGQGLRISTVSGTILINISAVTSYATDSVFASNRAGFTVTTTPTHPFIWSGQSDGDGLTGQIFDRTNNKFYEFTIMTNVAPVLSFIKIKRVL